LCVTTTLRWPMESTFKPEFMPDTQPDTSIQKYQKLVLGVIGAAMLATGGVMYAWGPIGNVFVSAILIRVGMLLCVMWLAFDQILQLSKYFSALVIGIGLAVLVLMAVRPNLSKVVLIMCAVLAAFSFFAKFVRTKT